MDYQNTSCVKIKKNNPWDKLPYQTMAPHQPVDDDDKKKHDDKKKYDDYGYGYDNDKKHDDDDYGYDRDMKKHDDDDYYCDKEKKYDDYCPAAPNPVFVANATLPLLRAVAVQQSGNTVFVTASIPAEALITLPTDALEIKRINKKLKVTQCRFFHSPGALGTGFPVDNPKLFIGGFVRKDIQFSKPKKRTKTTVEGEIRDFVADIPVSGVVDLGANLNIANLRFNREQEFEFDRRRRLGEGFPDKERLLSGDFTEFNLSSSEFLNRMPRCELVWSQITEMDEQLDRKPLWGGPFEEGTFRTIQEKMVIVVQVAITFPTLPTLTSPATDRICPC